MRVLESDRLLIKPVEEDDLAYLLDLRWDADIMGYLIHDPISMENQENWFRNLKKNRLAVEYLPESTRWFPKNRWNGWFI